MSQTIAELLLKCQELEEKLGKHRVCPVYSVLTRTGLEEVWEKFKEVPDLAIAFIDIDDLKKKNDELGQYEANKRLSEAFKTVRAKELLPLCDFEIGRFYYGDEAIIIAPSGDILKPCERLQSALRERQMSATIAVLKYTGQVELTDAVADANAVCAIAKRQGKNRIYSFL